MAGVRVAVRSACQADIPAVLAVWRDSSTKASSTDDASSLARVITVGFLVVAEIDGRIIGTLIAAWDGWRGNLYRLAVLPAHRRAGVGTMLVRQGEQLLRAQGAARINALVLGNQSGALSFWQALGYTADPHAIRAVKDAP